LLLGDASQVANVGENVQDADRPHGRRDDDFECADGIAELAQDCIALDISIAYPAYRRGRRGRTLSYPPKEKIPFKMAVEIPYTADEVPSNALEKLCGLSTLR
jgi:hypothetical protein